MNLGESRLMPEPRHEAPEDRVLRAKSESKVRNARELRAKPKSRAKHEIQQRGLRRGSVSPKFLTIHILEPVQSGV